jgi:hypothetical protein
MKLPVHPIPKGGPPKSPPPSTGRASKPGRPPGPVSKKPIGLGDAIKRVTTAVGIKPCKACEKRAEKLNRLFTIH